MKTVWKNETRTLSGRFFLARNYLQSRRYKNYKQSQCLFPSSARLSPFRYPPFSTFCSFLGPKDALKVQWNQGLGCSSLTPFSKIQTYIHVLYLVYKESARERYTVREYGRCLGGRYDRNISQTIWQSPRFRLNHLQSPIRVNKLPRHKRKCYIIFTYSGLPFLYF